MYLNCNCKSISKSLSKPHSLNHHLESVDTVFGHVSLGTRLELMRCRSAGGGVVTSLQESCR